MQWGLTELSANSRLDEEGKDDGTRRKTFSEAICLIDLIRLSLRVQLRKQGSNKHIFLNTTIPEKNLFFRRRNIIPRNHNFQGKQLREARVSSQGRKQTRKQSNKEIENMTGQHMTPDRLLTREQKVTRQQRHTTENEHNFKTKKRFNRPTCRTM